MIKYQIFNPITGVHTEAPDKQAALDTYNQFYTEVLSTRLIMPLMPLLATLEDDWYTAYGLWCKTIKQPTLSRADAVNTFFNKIDNPLWYSHSVYNLTTKEYWSNTFRFIFEDKEWHIKVTKGVLSDLYTRDVTIDGKHYDWVTYNLETNALYEYYISEGIEYMQTGSSLSKYYFDGNRFDSITYCVTSFDDLPSEQKVALYDMPWKNGITCWCNKSYGFIVEYRKPYGYDDLNAAQKNEYDSAVQAAKAKAEQETADMITLNRVVINSNGDATWESINVTELQQG